MTERPRLGPRLSAAVLLAPTAAAVLAGSLAWAAGQPPKVKPEQQTVAPSLTSDQADPELQKRTRAVDQLRQQVASLTAQLNALETADGGSSSTASSKRSGASSSSGAQIPRPTSKPKPTRTAAPPVHATTGAS